MPRGANPVTHISDEEIHADNTPVMGRIVDLLRPYRAMMMWVGIIVVLSAVLTSLIPFLTRGVFDHALFGPGGVDLRLLYLLAAALAIIPLATALLGIVQNWLTSTIGNSAMAELRGDLFEHLQKLELAFFTSTKTGAIQSRLANDVAGVRTVLTDTATTILQNSVTVISAVIAMVILSWQLTVVSLILMPAFIWLQLKVGKRRQRLARKTQESLSEMTAITEEALSVSGILLSKSFNRGDVEVRRYREANRQQTRLQVEQAMTGRAFFATVQTFFAMTPALLYIVAGHLAGTTGALTAGTIVAFTTLQARLQMPLLGLMRVSLDVQTSLALFRRIFEYLDLKPHITDAPDAIDINPDAVRGDVELQDVWFSYPAPRRLSGTRSVSRFDSRQENPTKISPNDALRWVLKGVSLKVEPGQFAAIVGPSGSGKTTLTYLVPRLYDVNRGTVSIDGVDVRHISAHSLIDSIGIVTQDPYLFHGTIGDNIAYGNAGATLEQVQQAARDANIHDRIMSFTDGYNTITGERGYRLSGGEKQRIAIARVMLKNPPIVILDEATSALDTETERLVQDALERATTNRTTIAVAHRLSTIRSADVIFVVDGGRIVERGSHDELLKLEGLYSRLHSEQFTQGSAVR